MGGCREKFLKCLQADIMNSQYRVCCLEYVKYAFSPKGVESLLPGVCGGNEVHSKIEIDNFLDIKEIRVM